MENHSQNTSPFSTPDYMADPYPYYAGLRADSPVVETTLPDQVQWRSTLTLRGLASLPVEF
jgi:hypothetical protein